MNYFVVRIKKPNIKSMLLLSLIALYLFTRLVNLTLLPIFNDESIYLHWGWISIHHKNQLYYSLFDGKQPLLMWIYGILQSYIADPLVAGRLVSVVTGFFTFLGIYFLGKYLLNKRLALLAGFLYIILPVFVLYDRQALMESAIGCVGVWLCLLFIKSREKPQLLYFLLSGLLLGLGLFIKSSAVLFLFTILALSFLVLFKSNNSAFKNKYLILFLFSLLVSQVILFPLYQQEHFKNIIFMNARYGFTLNELVHLPLLAWWHTMQTSFSLLFWLLNPFLFCSFLIGIYKSLKSSTAFRYTLYWFLLTIVFFILFTRSASIRYIVAFLPLAMIFSAVGIMNLWEKSRQKPFMYSLISVSVCWSLFFSTLLLIHPLLYFETLGKYTPIVNKEYIYGWTSGYGIVEARDYLVEESKQQPLRVVMRSDSGNPEDAMFVYLNNYKNIATEWLQFSCTNGRANIPLTQPTYFVSRDSNLSTIGDCVQEVKRFYKPDRKSFVGIYKVL